MRSAVLVLAAAVFGAGLGACDDDGGDGGGESRRPRATTTTAPPPTLTFASPDGAQHTFRVVETDVGLSGIQAVAEVEITNALDTPDRRQNRPQAESRRLMIGVNQERYGGACPGDYDDPYDYFVYTTVAGYCVITSSSLAEYDLPREAGASVIIVLTADLAHTLGVEPADIAVFFFDPMVTLTPVREVLPEGATYDVIQRPECPNPVSGQLRPECEATHHPDLLVRVP
jgi:hypothetical protein